TCRPQCLLLFPYTTLFRSRVIEPYPNTNQIAFGDKNGVVHLYDTADFRAIAKQQVHSLPVTALAATDTSLLTGGRDAKLVSVAADRKSTRLNSSHVKISYA